MKHIMVRVNDKLSLKIKKHLLDRGLTLQTYLTNLIAQDLQRCGLLDSERHEMESAVEEAIEKMPKSDLQNVLEHIKNMNIN